MTREELLEQLLIERYTNPWWTTRADPSRAPAVAHEWDDCEITTARRRRELLAATEKNESEVA